MAHAIAIVEVLQHSIDLQKDVLVAIEDLVHYEVTLEEVHNALEFLEECLHQNER